MKIGKVRPLVIALPLLMGACGQVTTGQNDTATVPVATPVADMSAGAKTFSEALKEPGWVQTSPGFWERDTENGHESIYMGVNGAKQALKQREAIQTQMLQHAPAAEQAKLSAQFKSQNASLIRSIDSAPQGNISIQSVFQCTYDQSVQRLTAQPGIKATAWINCPEAGYYPNAGATVQSNNGYQDANPTKSATAASANASIPGTSGCSGYAFSEATDSSGAHVGNQKSGNGC